MLEQNLVSLFDAFGGTVLYVSHDIDEALRFCDRIAVVDAGRIMEIDSGDDLVNNPRSVAALKLSGCKNATPVARVDDKHVWSAKWGVTVEVDGPVADDVAYLGVRARYLEQVDGPGRNCFRMRVDRASDSRFERTVLLGFLDRDEREVPTVGQAEDEMKYLHQHMFWRVPKVGGGGRLPEVGDEVWIRIPTDRIYLVAR